MNSDKKNFLRIALDITILSNSNLWKATDNPELKDKLAEMNKYLRDIKPIS
jgi:hypothetical protein